MASPAKGKLGWCTRALIAWFFVGVFYFSWYTSNAKLALRNRAPAGHDRDPSSIDGTGAISVSSISQAAEAAPTNKAPVGIDRDTSAQDSKIDESTPANKAPIRADTDSSSDVDSLAISAPSHENSAKPSLAIDVPASAGTDPASIEGPEIISLPPHISEGFGKSRFADHIEEFLRTASRSPKPAQDICDRQHLPSASQCPSWRWLTQYHGPETDGRPPVFVDIGCNKGYSIASFYEHFAPASGISKKSIFLTHMRIGTKKACGVCQDCRDISKLGKNRSPAHIPRAYCIDASPFTHNQTKTVANMLKTNNPQGQGWQLFHQAMTNRTGYLKFQVCGSESCSIDRGGAGSEKTVKVPAFAYDDFVDLKKIDFVDLVKLDTEGEEPLVIQGMHKSLKAQKVGFLAFELQGFGFSGWYPHFDIRRIVDLLDAYGYDCYMDTHSLKSGIARLTGCKDSRFEQPYSNKKGRVKQDGVIPQWGNLICGLRSNAEIRNILSGMSM